MFNVFMLFMLFMLFVRVKFSRKKKKRSLKLPLITSFTILLRYLDFLCHFINGILTRAPKLFHDLANKKQVL